jgi:hypothetical protein
MTILFDQLALKPHPSTPPGGIGGVSCGVSWGDAGEWVLDFIIDAPPSALRLPPATTPSRADGLWQTTCFELFLRRPGSEIYIEFNFSPSGEWAAYGFDGYRDHMHDLKVTSPRITTSDPEQSTQTLVRQTVALGIDPDTARKLAAATPVAPGAMARFALSAAFDDPDLVPDGPWRAGLSAVVEEADGNKSYWALNHPSDKPDFHHRDSFVLELP